MYMQTKWNANKTIEYLSYGRWKRETSLSSVGVAFATQTSAEVSARSKFKLIYYEQDYFFIKNEIAK